VPFPEMEGQTYGAEDLVTEIVRIRGNVTQVAAAVVALLACEVGTSVSNCVATWRTSTISQWAGMGVSLLIGERAR
jgi:hypothetical protein